MRRLFAHRIIFGDKIYTNHVAEFGDDGRPHFFPFTEEIHSTVFVSGTVRVFFDSSGMSYEKIEPVSTCLSEEVGSL